MWNLHPFDGGTEKVRAGDLWGDFGAPPGAAADLRNRSEERVRGLPRSCLGLLLSRRLREPRDGDLASFLGFFRFIVFFFSGLSLIYSSQTLCI